MTQDIELSKLQPHPDNPRLIMRDDVVTGIAAQIEESGSFDPAHALLVRPVNGHYQIIRGHHRFEAARRAGLDSVPCWVREMTDDEAYMQLALGNVQGELSPLEIGIHALKAVEIVEGGRGIKGGISEYARQLGMESSRANLSSYRNAAFVLKHTQNLFNVKQVLDKAAHLAAIHKAPESTWQILVEWLVTPKDPGKPDSTPSVNQTTELVKEVNKFEIPEEWQDVFLPLPSVVGSFIREKNPTPQAVRDIVTTAENTKRIIDAACKDHGDSFPYQPTDFTDWLRAGMGLTAWDVNEIRKYQLDVITAAREASKPPEPDPQPGEWWQLGQHRIYCGDTGNPDFWAGLPDAAFAFADPPYNAGAAEWDSGFKWAHDWLIAKAPIVAVTPGISAIDSFFREDTEMPYVWSMSAWIKNGMTRGALGYGNWIYIALFSTLESVNERQQDCLEVTIKTSQTKQTNHKGRKPQELLERLLQIFTTQDDTVIDPFLGSGTTLFVAERTGRACIGGEIDPAFCKDIIMQWQEMTGQAATRV